MHAESKASPPKAMATGGTKANRACVVRAAARRRAAPISSRQDGRYLGSTTPRSTAGCVPECDHGGWATAAWTGVSSSEVPSAPSRHEARGFEECSRWSRSKATTPPETHAKEKSRIPAGMPAPGAPPLLATLRVAGCHGDRFPVVSLRSTTGYTLRNLRFRERGPIRSVLGGKDVIPLHWNARVFAEGARMGSLGWVCSPCSPGPKPDVCRGRGRETKNFLRVDRGPSFATCR